MAPRVVRSLLAVIIAGASFVALGLLGLLFGGTECDRSECNWFGEFASGTAPLYEALALTLGIALGLAVARPWRR